MTTHSSFISARPVWVRGLHERMNTTVGFYTALEFTGQPLRLRLAAANTYRVWLNGEFFAYGPARAAHGHLRIDEWDLTLKSGINHLAIEVVAYRANSFSVLNAAGYLQAEVISDQNDDTTAVAWTCSLSGHFKPGVLTGRVRRVKRYSYQRPFTEVYRLTAQSDSWRTSGWEENPPYLDNLVEERLLPRRMPYPDFPLRKLSRIGGGQIEPAEGSTLPHDDRYTKNIGLNLLGFTNDEIEADPTLDWNRCKFVNSDVLTEPQLPAGHFVDYDLEANFTGFLRLTLTCEVPTRLLAGWSEIRTPERLDVYQQETINLVSWELAPGSYTLETFEAYTFQHLRLAVLEGGIKLASVEQRGYESSASLSAFSSDPELARIQRAALSTFRQNTVDVFMDCPSRERAGWLGDSFFIARAAATLGHPLAAETAFLENFLHAPNPFYSLPSGMFPMCYPSDHYHPQYIPQWSLWLVLQLGEYKQRGGEFWLITAFGPRLRALFDWFESYANDLGLLEKLPGWNFVEWSKANQLVQDVNFPTQFLYAAALRTAATLYGNSAWKQRADSIEQMALKLSKSENSLYFCDRALRSESGLVVTEDSTEICQYSPFFFGTLTLETAPDLWQKLITDFGPGKRVDGVHPANLLFGWVMRFDLLQRAGLNEQLCEEVKSMFGPMSLRTGTLWEHDHATASLCHGFGSYALSLINQA